MQLREGDKVVTIGGIIGEIVAIDASQVVLEVAPNITIRVLRSAISNRLHSQANKEPIQTSSN